MPSPIQQCVDRLVQESFHDLKYKLKEDSSLLDDFSSRLCITTGQVFTNFKGKWEGSRAVPDLGIAWRVEESNPRLVSLDSLRFVVEAGASQTKSSLTEVAKMWLEGMGEGDKVNGVLFIQISESPAFHFPTTAPTNQCRDTVAAKREMTTCSLDPFKGIEVFGHTWYGGVAEAYAELWKLGPDGTARREGEVIVRNFNLLHPQMALLTSLHSQFIIKMAKTRRLR